MNISPPLVIAAFVQPESHEPAIGTFQYFHLRIAAYTAPSAWILPLSQFGANPAQGKSDMDSALAVHRLHFALTVTVFVLPAFCGQGQRV